MVALSGRYALGGEPIVVRGVSLTLEGVGPEGATIDAEGLSRAIEVKDGARLTLRHIDVVNGHATAGGGLSVHGAGSSLLMEQSSIRDSVATGAYPEGGGGLHASKGASAVLVESAITGCEATSPSGASGGGAYATTDSNLTLRGSQVERCRAFWGGGIALATRSHVEIEGSVLRDCHATDYSGGLHLQPVRPSRVWPRLR